MPSNSETATETNQETPEKDEAREGLLEALVEELGHEIILGQHLQPNTDLALRIAPQAWDGVADYLRNRQRFRFFEWLSAIDWMPSPYGRSHEAEVDKLVAATTETETDAGTQAKPETAKDNGKTGTGADGYCGGNSRFQMVARVHNLTTNVGLTLKTDVSDALTVATWSNVFPGAAWHEREVHEMFGISFNGLADHRNLYLPGEFEGYPMRKDFPLMARLVKPWPGIVDVEVMPETGEPTPAGASATNPEAG